MKLTPWFVAAVFFASCPAFADKPDWAGSGKHGKNERAEKRPGEDRASDEGLREERNREKRFGEDPRLEVRIDFRFGEEHRRAIYDYYGAQVRAGHCPPGLAKKRNGCLPPGQAKKWRVGQPLPPGLVLYDLPPEVLLRLPPPPPHHRYVRVAGDILLIAVGTSMVIDAIEDIIR